MDLTISQPEISGQHAALAWNGSAWTVRDLGSRNGTAVAGTPLPPGEDRVLNAGDIVVFGDAHAYTLISGAPPCPWARQGDHLVEGDQDMLALPSPEDPQLVIVWEDKGWMALEADSGRPIADGDTVTVGGRDWVIGIPEVLEATTERRAQALSLDDLELHFGVSGDEEYVEMSVVVPATGDTHAIKPKAHHYLLLTLARQRLEDAEASEADAGWVYTADLCKMLRASSNQLYVSFHRARKDLSSLEVDNPGELIQRRSTTRQVRLGIASCTIRTL